MGLAAAVRARAGRRRHRRARALTAAPPTPIPKTRTINSHESVALSFNGGKDSTVLLHLLRLALFSCGGGGGGGGGNGKDDDDSDHPGRNGLLGVRSFYFDTSAPAAAAAGIAEERNGGCGDDATSALTQQQQPGDFCEVASFVRATDAAYGLKVDYLTDRDFKRGLERYCLGGGGDDNNKKIAAILLGTRRGDPNAEGQDHFCPSSRGWPPFLRVNPVLDWGYGDVWRFLRVGGLSYCSLYDRGYTSLGSPATTAPNAALQRADGSFAPAHELADGRLERQGRRVRSAASSSKGQQQHHETTTLEQRADAAEAPSPSSPQPQTTTTTTTTTRTRYAVVVLVGDELLAGRVRDANGSFLCAELRRMGWAVRRVVIVPDDVESVALAVAAASRDADAVLTAGGVGPTRDDVTMAGVAGAIEGGGGRLLRHPEAEQALVEYFGARKVTDAHLKMAEVPGAGDVELVWVEEEVDDGGETTASSSRRRRSPFPLVRVNNIYVLPGVPSFLRRKWVEVKKRLHAMDAAAGGEELQVATTTTATTTERAPSLGTNDLLPFKSATLRLHAPDEAAVAPCLDALADERGAGVMIGSYPVDVWGDGDENGSCCWRGGGGEWGEDEGGGEGGGGDAAAPTTTPTKTTTLRVVLESKDSAGLDAAVDRLAELLREKLGEGALLGVER
jgi:FAD synthetase